jgi:hypothetical protein
MIRVWRFEDAPQEYRDLSPHGGDEDWLAVVPWSMKDDWIPWLEGGGPFGVCDVSRHELDETEIVYIGAHA